MLHHLYGILGRLPHAAGLPDTGIDDRPVHARRIGRFVVLATALESPPRPGPRALGRHLDVLGAMSTPGPLFPLPYGIAIPPADVAPWLAARAGIIRAGLALVRGRVEMRVSVLALHFGEGDPRRLRAVADRVTAAAGYGSWRSRLAGRGSNAAITLAFLVPRSEVTTFLARIAPIVARAATGGLGSPLAPHPSEGGLGDPLAAHPTSEERLGPLAPHRTSEEGLGGPLAAPEGGMGGHLEALPIPKVAVVPSGPWPASTFVPSLDRSFPSLADPAAVASI